MPMLIIVWNDMFQGNHGVAIRISFADKNGCVAIVPPGGNGKDGIFQSCSIGCFAVNCQHLQRLMINIYYKMFRVGIIKFCASASNIAVGIDVLAGTGAGTFAVGITMPLFPVFASFAYATKISSALLYRKYTICPLVLHQKFSTVPPYTGGRFNCRGTGGETIRGALRGQQVFAGTLALGRRTGNVRTIGPNLTGPCSQRDSNFFTAVLDIGGPCLGGFLRGQSGGGGHAGRGLCAGFFSLASLIWWEKAGTATLVKAAGMTRTTTSSTRVKPGRLSYFRHCSIAVPPCNFHILGRIYCPKMVCTRLAWAPMLLYSSARYPFTQTSRLSSTP